MTHEDLAGWRNKSLAHMNIPVLFVGKCRGDVGSMVHGGFDEHVPVGRVDPERVPDVICEPRSHSDIFVLTRWDL